MSDQPYQPLLADRSKLSMIYGVNEYEEMLRQKMSQNSEIAQLKAMSPDQQGPSASAADGMLKSSTEADGKSKKGKREFPTPNKPDPMPRELEFLFTRISPEQMLYMWNVYTALFCSQCACVLAYCFMLSQDVDWYLATALFGVPMAGLMIQNVYILHDVLHGATFPPYEWQKYITHCWADQFSLPWEEVVLEHQRHHASTVDLLVHGEFGWDPAGWLYVLQEWTDRWYGWLTVPLVPVWHWIGANDTGALFAMLWYSNFPDQGAGGKCNKDFWVKWIPNRIRHCLFVASLWTCVWLLGTWPLGRPLSEGWRFFIPVTAACRTGFTIAWTFFTNFNHSHWWNEFLALNPNRSYPVLSKVMACLLGGRHRFNEMLFHDLHHAFPNAVGALSQRGRFHGWEKVHDAAVDVLSRGLFLPPKDGNQEPPMQKLQQKRSLLATSGDDRTAALALRRLDDVDDQMDGAQEAVARVMDQHFTTEAPLLTAERLDALREVWGEAEAKKTVEEAHVLLFPSAAEQAEYPMELFLEDLAEFLQTDPSKATLSLVDAEKFLGENQ